MKKGSIYSLIALSITIAFVGCSQPVDDTYSHKYRPQIHYSPEKNWMNDPNGMFYDDGLYHLYYQYNPFDERWGHMSWGHATSEDLVHWEHHPVALMEEDSIMIFSGSAVVDINNTSGFGDEENYPIVAIYTGYDESKGIQHQDIAYSLDGGYTFTKYEGNPVIDLNLKDFRDPKVFWHDETEKWIMVVAMSADHYVQFYGSENLIDWEHLSDFGPQGASGGLWECPDLFRLPVDGDPNTMKWVLQVDLGSNSNNPGSGGQYFIGEFDGVTFTPDEILPEIPEVVPEGIVFEDFEGDYSKWTTEGTAFGEEPVTGAFPNQNPVTEFVGSGLVNSFIDGDGPTGALTSDSFIIDHSFINLKVGGGAHVDTGVELIVNNKVVRSASGTNSETLRWIAWNVNDFEGQEAQIRIIDSQSEGWGHVLVDQIIFADAPAQNLRPGARWIDHGADFYAAVSWFNWDETMPTQWLAWSNNWAYAQDIPTEGWRSSMSLARNVELRTINGKISLYQTPVESYQDLRKDHVNDSDIMVNNSTSALAEDIQTIMHGGLFEIELSIGSSDATEYGLTIKDDADGLVSITINQETDQLIVQRVESDPDFIATTFSEPQIIDLDGLQVEDIHLIFDKSLFEIYINGGEYTFVNRIFMNTDNLTSALFAENGTFSVSELNVWGLGSAWKNQD